MYFVTRGRISFAFRLTIEVNIQIYFAVSTSRNSCPKVFCKKGVLRNIAKFTGKHLCQSLFFNKIAGNFIKKEALAQEFSCEFCEISKNANFYRTASVAASVAKLQQFIGRNFDHNQKCLLHSTLQVLQLCR